MEQDALYTRIDRAVSQVATIKNKQARRDLKRMLQSADAAMTNIDRELVNCRRLNRPTIKHSELVAKAEKILDFLEQHIVFATLIG
jgi:hypothetical protein